MKTFSKNKKNKLRYASVELCNVLDDMDNFLVILVYSFIGLIAIF